MVLLLSIPGLTKFFSTEPHLDEEQIVTRGAERKFAWMEQGAGVDVLI